MTTIRTTLGAIALTALVFGTVCGVLGLGTHTVAYPWLIGLVAVLGWDAIWYVQHRRGKDPVTLPVAPWYVLTEDTSGVITETYIDHPHGWQHIEGGKRAMWPHEIGAPE